jgi:dTDP-4-dehydrorhamnose 3,5-epimerase
VVKVIKTTIEDLLIIEPKVFGDERGCFFEAYHEKRYKENGIPYTFVQDNRSMSTKGVLRGLHFQKTKPQGKLVSVISGEVLDVSVDLRPNSTTFGCHEAVLLTGKNHRQLFVPPGFAHGFAVISDVAEFNYKCTDYYDPNDEGGIIWNDPQLAIDWKIITPSLSEKDKEQLTLAEYKLLMGIEG